MSQLPIGDFPTENSPAWKSSAASLFRPESLRGRPWWSTPKASAFPSASSNGANARKRSPVCAQALAEAAGQSREKQQTIDDMLGKKYGAIFAAHAMLMEDPELVSQIEKLIREQDHSAEYAVSKVIRQHAKTLENLNNAAVLQPGRRSVRHRKGHPAQSCWANAARC